VNTKTRIPQAISWRSLHHTMILPSTVSFPLYQQLDFSLIFLSSILSAVHTGGRGCFKDSFQCCHTVSWTD
jgi:hypothetical protein